MNADETGPKAQVAAVLALHAQRSFTNDHMAPYTAEVCVECRQVWPCATVRAIEALVCSTCKGETWIPEPDYDRDSDGVVTETVITVTCPNCTTLEERRPHPVDPNEEPF